MADFWANDPVAGGGGDFWKSDPVATATPSKFGLGDTWPARLAKDIYSAVTLPGDVYQGKAAVPQSENMVGGENVDNIGRVTNLAGIATPIAPGSVAATKVVPASAPTMAETKTSATSVYQNPEVRRTLIPQQEVAGIGAQAADTFIKDHKQVAAVASEMQNAKPWDTSIDKLDSWSQRLGALGKEMQMGRAGPEATPKAAAAMSLKNQIDELVSNASPQWATADQNYSVFKAAQAFDKKATKADVLARGGDYAQRLSTAATQMLANPRATRGWDAEQLAMLKKISEKSAPQKALTWFSNLLGNKLKHGVGTIIGGGAGFSGGGPVGAALGAAAGAAADTALSGGIMGIRNILANRQTNNLLQSLLSTSPLAKSLPQTQVVPAPLMGGLINAQRLPLPFFPGQIPAYADEYQRR